MRTSSAVAVVFASLALGSPSAAYAQESGVPQTLTIVAENESAPGDREPSGMVLPGDVVRYVLTFTNAESTPVRNVVLDNPIPAGMEYVGGSGSASSAGVAVEFSVDGGATYSAQPLVERVVDGSVERVPAPASTYTNVRWTLRDWVEPGMQVRAEFRARLTDPEGAR